MSFSPLIYILPALLLAISLTLSGLSSFFFRKDKLPLYIFLKGSAITSIAILGLVIENLLGVNALSGSTTFILIALLLEIFSIIVYSLPSKTNMFAPLYRGLDMCSALMLGLAGLFFIPLSPLGLPIGFGVGIIVAVIVALAIRNFNWQTDIFKYVTLALGIALLGQVILILITTISLQTIFFSVGSVLYVTGMIIKLFFKDINKKLVIARDIIYHIALILIVSSIFVSIF